MDAIVAFHSIDDSGSVLSYSPRELEQLVDGLLAQDVAIVTLDQLVAPTDGSAGTPAVRASRQRPRVALTFDDGMASVHTAALPILAKRKLPFTVHVVSDWVGRDNRWPSQPAGIARFELMSWSQLAELRDAGATIGGHTANHVALRGVDDATARRELVESRQTLEQRLGVAVRHFAYPYGVFDASAVARVKEHYATAATTRLAFLHDRDPHRLPRLDAWYLREPARRAPLFSAASRARLRLRALLRRVKSTLRGPADRAAYGG
jgi:peptidoglycan/xylan/chitin deacetylase (PgdA/CDA1 family)